MFLINGFQVHKIFSCTENLLGTFPYIQEIHTKIECDFLNTMIIVIFHLFSITLGNESIRVNMINKITEMYYAKFTDNIGDLLFQKIYSKIGLKKTHFS